MATCQGFCEARPRVSLDGCYVGSARRCSSVVSRARLVALRVVVSCALFSVSWFAHTSTAGADPRTAELALEPDAGCASVEALRARISAHGWRWVSAPAEQAELRLLASVRAHAEHALQVSLRVRWRDGREAQRALAAQSCEAAVDALVLLIQMTLDAAERAQAQPMLVDEAEEDPDEPAAERASWATVTQVALGANVGLGAGPAPTLQPGVGGYAALDLRGFGWLRPRFLLELSHAWRSGVATGSGTADFALDGGQVSVCPLGLRGLAFAALGCGTFELGRLTARGYDSYEPRTQTRAWASAGLGALLLGRPMSRVELQLGAALSRPLWRDQFSFAPEVFYAVPAWRWQIKLGLAVLFL